MKVVFRAVSWQQYIAWQIEDPKILARINILIAEARRDPFRGTGKPEPLKKNLSGFWSRRIASEHRLVYRVSGKGDAQALEILSCRYRY